MSFENRKKLGIVLNKNAGLGVDLPPTARRMLKMPVKELLTADEIIERLHSIFSEYNIKPDVCVTEYAGHGVDLAREMAEKKYDAVVAIGGDGTVNEVVNGLVGSETALGIIPFGTANLLAGELGLPTALDQACQVIYAGRTENIDTCVVQGRHFTIMAGIGFDAHVVRLVDRHIKSKWGALSYPMVTLREMIRYPFRKIRATTDGGEDLKGFYMFVQNAKCYGSGFSASPTSKMDDGVFEVIVFPSKTIFSLLLYLFSKDKDRFHVVTKGVKSLRIDTTHDIQIDGDYYCDGPAEIKIMPRALKVIVV